MGETCYAEIRRSLSQLYFEDPRPWLVGFSGGKDSTLVAALVFESVMAIPPERRTKPVSVLCTDTRVEIPAIAESAEGVMEQMRCCSQREGLNIQGHPMPSENWEMKMLNSERTK